MRGGFSFKGVHSSEFGVYETPESRVLMPAKRRTLIDIPGRSTAYIQEDGGWEARVESISCSYVPPNESVSLQHQVRLIAGWLQGVGELVFDYEPEMRYNAFLSSAPPTVKDMNLNYSQFTLEFTCNHPFAYEPAQQDSTLSGDNQPIQIQSEGTVNTPVRIIIKNVGSNVIHNLTVTQEFIT